MVGRRRPTSVASLDRARRERGSICFIISHFSPIGQEVFAGNGGSLPESGRAASFASRASPARRVWGLRPMLGEQRRWNHCLGEAHGNGVHLLSFTVGDQRAGARLEVVSAEAFGGWIGPGKG